MTAPECPVCGGAMAYKGIDDGGGDWGDAVCDHWYCDTCDYDHEGDCIGGSDDYDDYGDDFDEEPPLRFVSNPADLDDIPW